MTIIRTVGYSDGDLRQIGSPDVVGLPSYSFASLPTLGSTDQGLVFCSDYPGLGRCQVTWVGDYWCPVGIPPAPRYRTGGVMGVSGQSISQTTTALALTANLRRAWPFYVQHAFSTNRVQFDVVTAGAAGTLANVALYYSDPATGLPGTQVSGTLGANMSTAAISAAVTATLAPATVYPGMHWLVLHVSGAPTLRAAQLTLLSPNLGYTLAGGANQAVMGLTLTTAFGALPTTNPMAGATNLVNSSMPIVNYRVQ